MTFGLSAASKYDLKKKREAERQRKHSAAGRDIGDLPNVADPIRKEAASRNLALFAKTYLPRLFPLSWSQSHLVAIARMETAALQGGLFALAMPRGSGKSTLARACALWSILYGHTRYALVIGATSKAARKTIAALKTIIASNEVLAADFPEACYPVLKLGGVNQRAPGQLYKGKPTELSWKGDYLQLASIEGSACSGGIIDCVGMTGEIRGRNVQQRDGSSVRPSFVVIDDPQTKGSARSHSQTNTRREVILADVLGLVGPGESLSVIMPCTIIEPEDLAAQFLDRSTMPAWQGETTSMLVKLPQNEDAVARYREAWSIALANGQPTSALREVYRLDQTAIEAEAQASWPDRFDKDELSAIQHALHLRFKVGDKAWFAEYQNHPLAENQSLSVAPRETILSKLNRIERRVLPTTSTALTLFVDVQLAALYYVATAFDANWSAAVIEWGTWPEQPTPLFTLADLPRTIQRQFPGLDDKAAIRAALDACLNGLFGRKWSREDGLEIPIAAAAIDSGWGQMSQVVYDFAKSTPHKSSVFASKGKGIGPANKPLSEYRRNPGALIGEGWLLDRLDTSPGQRLFTIDTNHWKTRVHRALLSPIGSTGALTFWGADAHRHEQIADHLTSEAPIETFGQGRRVDVWKTLARSDNHLFDCIVGCYALAAMRGVGTMIQAPTTKPRSAQRKIQI
jgi:hypothetical protein